jgi:hypothetical protein
MLPASSLTARVAANVDSTDSPRQRAARALAANPGASLTAIAKIAGCSRGRRQRSLPGARSLERRKLTKRVIWIVSTERILAALFNTYAGIGG